MRKGILLIFTMLATLIGCGQYDDSELKSDINDLKSRMAALEQQCKNMNENLTSLQTIVNASQKQDGIVSVTDLPDGQGYSVKFVSGKVIYLYNGTNGTGSSTPKISVRQDSDGIYYWTVDGEWLIVDGKKVRASATDGKDAVTPQFKIEDGFWYVSYDGGNSWSKLGKATGDDGKDSDGFFKSVTVEDGYAVFVMNDSEQTTLRIPVAGVSAVSSIKYVPESLDGIVKVRYSKIGGKNVPVDIVIMFEVMPQGAVDYIVKNWKEVLTAKAIYASSTKVSIGDFVTMNIKDVVGGEDNIIVVTIDSNSLDDSFFSTDIPVAANLRLSVKMNGSESISSDYLPLSSLLSYDQIIEYTTVTGERMDYDSFFEFKRGNSVLSLTDDSHVGNVWRIYIEGSPVETNLFSCIFDKKRYYYNYPGDFNFDLKSLSFVTPIELGLLSFSGCHTLVKADILNVNTKNVTNMNRMFNDCSSLVSLDLSGFDTKNVTRMSGMFSGCSGLTSLDLSGFDTKNVTSMSGMFRGCSGLTSLDLSGFDTKNLTDMSQMFGICSGLTSLDLSGFDTKNVTSMSGMFSGCSGLTSLDLSGFDTKNVTDMSQMFGNCSGLTSLDLSGFDTRNVMSLCTMFFNCSGLTSLDLSGFDTKNVRNMACMFEGCSALASIDLSGFDTKNVTNMYRMFYGCKGLASLDLTSFDTKSVTFYGMSYMFYGCEGLTSLDLSGFDTKNVSEIYSMFEGCRALTSLDLSSFDTKNIVEMAMMFKNCGALTSLDLSGFDTKNVRDMSSMFAGCSALTSLDLSSFDMRNVTKMGYMFDLCTNLKEIIMRGCDKTTIEMISKVKPEGAVIITD